MGSSSSKMLPASQISAETAQKGLPTNLKVTYKKGTMKIICLLSEPDSEPSYCVSLPKGFWGSMIIHDGPSDQHPALATIKSASKWGNSFAVALPASPNEGVENRDELIKWEAKLGKKEQWWFGLEVGHGSTRRLERFEWRRSHGTEVQSLGGSKWGWKLVRLAAQQQNASGDGFASDGGEIVAVWADATGFTMSRVGELSFRGTGATGELGQSWSIMVVSSCFCMWLTTMQQNNTVVVSS